MFQASTVVGEVDWYFLCIVLHTSTPLRYTGQDGQSNLLKIMTSVTRWEEPRSTRNLQQEEKGNNYTKII